MTEEPGFVQLDEAASQSIMGCAVAYEEATQEMLGRWERERLAKLDSEAPR